METGIIQSFREGLVLCKCYYLTVPCNGEVGIIASVDKRHPSRFAGHIQDQFTAYDSWGGDSRPLILACGNWSLIQPSAIPDRLLRGREPTSFDSRMEGVRRIAAQVYRGGAKGIYHDSRRSRYRKVSTLDGSNR
jgi:hypothetical protein